MKLMPCLLSACLLVVSHAGAEQAPVVRQGTAGLTPFTLSIYNAGSKPLDCQATTAHWYSVALGQLALGQQLNIALWKNTASGEVIMLNRSLDQMPLQRLWCGEEGKSWQTRADIRLPNHRGATVQSIALDCTANPSPVECRPITPD
ncbi:hypothetical protein [Biostraticola tofi]|uniref:Uncharacterized protein n=1 Tax=Biostraticola tofi TaxID=466109 RepID=A0A4R3Z3R9_9GAMM|nr:hypothetical protein [Biostraticola tofi]TCW00472.1 hypothetical protein EDC52_101829 [Biostraticola tofi]